jgi:Tfp pilus assembly major pilin PilA
VKCHACGHDNADSALFCTACRRPLVAPTKLPTRLEPLAATAAPSVAAMPPQAAAAPVPGDVGGRNRFAPPETGASARAGRMDTDSQIITDDEVRSAVIGPSSTLYYLGAFDRIGRGEGSGWNWPAFFVTWYWLLYRKMWVPALIYFVVPTVINIFLLAVIGASPVVGGLMCMCWLAAWLIGPGMLANGWYYRHCLGKIRDVRARGGSKDQVLARLEAAGGTTPVGVIIAAVLSFLILPGMLAAIALPQYQTYTVKAKVADAIVASAEVAQAAGRQYEATGQFPTDIDRIAQQAAHPSKYVKAIEMDGTSGTITVQVEATPTISGTILLTPSADSSRHVTWSCSTTDLLKYVPQNCRG